MVIPRAAKLARQRLEAYRRALKRADLRREAARQLSVKQPRLARAKAMPLASDDRRAKAYDPRDAMGARLCMPIRQQANDDSRCTSYAIAAAMESWWCRDIGRALQSPFLSIDELDPGDADLLITMDRAVDKGCVTEDCRPPGGRLCPGAATQRWRLHADQLARVPHADRVRVLRNWLEDHGPFAFALQLFDDLRAFTDRYDRAIYMTTEQSRKVQDAHAFCVIGYESGPIPCWIVKNSWGTEWGCNGFGRIACDDHRLKPESLIVAVRDVEVPDAPVA